MGARQLSRSTALCVAILTFPAIEQQAQADQAPALTAEKGASTGNSRAESTPGQRRAFQDQELTTSRSSHWIFNPGDPPRIVSRDAEEVQRLGFRGPLRQCAGSMRNSTRFGSGGIWARAAWIEGTAPNGTSFRRAMTFYARPKNFLIYFAPDLQVSLPHFPGPIAPEVWREHEADISRVSTDALLRAVNDSEAGAILLAGLAESQPLGRAAQFVDSVAVLNDDFHLALKLKVRGFRTQFARYSRRDAVPRRPSPFIKVPTSKPACVPIESENRFRLPRLGRRHWRAIRNSRRTTRRHCDA